MPNSLKCQVCSKPATVHLTQILSGEIKKVDLCEACAQAKGITDSNGFSLADLLVKTTLNAEAMTEQLVCEQCGFTQAQFKKTGRLGCPACWVRFRELIDPLLVNMHRGTSHRGKVPGRGSEVAQAQAQLEKLKAELQRAIAAERYEDAARFRDEIQQIQQGREARPTPATDEA